MTRLQTDTGPSRAAPLAAACSHAADSACMRRPPAFAPYYRWPHTSKTLGVLFSSFQNFKKNSRFFVTLNLTTIYIYI
jgi:hypothetical protein